jgi:ribosome maturation protein SDO1
VARYHVKNKRFEILVDPDKALDYRMGKRKDFDGVLLYDTIFTDSGKGLKASKEDLQRVFGTTDPYEIGRKVVMEGEVPLKTEQKRALIEDKKKQIIAYISRHCIDTRTKAPIPPLRVERALEEIDLKIDPFKPAEAQIPEILKKLAELIPIKQQSTQLRVRVPAAFVGKSFGYIKENSEILEEEWQSDGSCLLKVVIPSGIISSFIGGLGGITRGAAQVEVLEER